MLYFPPKGGKCLVCGLIKSIKKTLHKKNQAFNEDPTIGSHGLWLGSFDFPWGLKRVPGPTVWCVSSRESVKRFMKRALHRNQTEEFF